jgi:hypothetical protein
MEALSKFETNLLTIAQALFAPEQAARGVVLIHDELPQPSCLSAAAVRILKDTLRKGLVRFFVQQGAWQRTSCLSNDSILHGRLWEIHPEEVKGFTFSAYTIHILQWLTATNARDQKLEVHLAAPLTLGDSMILILAMNLVATKEPGKTGEQEWAAPWKRTPHFGRDGLLQLLFPGVDSNTRHEVDFARWLTPQGLFVVQGLQSLLAERWEQAQRSAIAGLHQERVLAELAWQDSLLREYLTAIDRIERRDLGKFLLLTSKALFTEEMTFARWTERLETRTLRLSERAELYAQAIMFANHFETLENWYRESLTIGYLDEGYAQSQWYKGVWEQLDLQSTANHAAALRRGADPLR